MLPGISVRAAAIMAAIATTGFATLASAQERPPVMDFGVQGLSPQKASRLEGAIKNANCTINPTNGRRVFESAGLEPADREAAYRHILEMETKGALASDGEGGFIHLACVPAGPPVPMAGPDALLLQ